MTAIPSRYNLAMTRHPMDEIPGRQLRFQSGLGEGRNPLWSQSSPDFAMFINAMGIHIPHFERFLVSVMRVYRDELQDEQLLDDLQAIIGQESHHAFNFLCWTRELTKRYPEIADLNRQAEKYFARAIKNRSKKFQIGFTAGYETFTFLGGMIILNRYKELMEHADPVLRGLWVWHQVEEVEHGSVAFDFYQYFYCKQEWYRRLMVLYAFFHIAKETFLAYKLMVKGEGYRGTRKLKAWSFFWSFAFDLAWAALPVLSSNYHPRKHPICNDEQNSIAVAWREYYAAGNKIETLTDDDMFKIRML